MEIDVNVLIRQYDARLAAANRDLILALSENEALSKKNDALEEEIRQLKETRKARKEEK